MPNSHLFKDQLQLPQGIFTSGLLNLLFVSLSSSPPCSPRYGHTSQSPAPLDENAYCHLRRNFKLSFMTPTPNYCSHTLLGDQTMGEGRWFQTDPPQAIMVTACWKGIRLCPSFLPWHVLSNSEPRIRPWHWYSEGSGLLYSAFFSDNASSHLLSCWPAMAGNGMGTISTLRLEKVSRSVGTIKNAHGRLQLFPALITK